MAGFDFTLRFHASQADLLAVCLKASMSRARKLSLSWRNERLGSGELRCAIEGNGRRMDLLAHALERDLPLVAEGAHNTGFSLSRRRRLGLGFADLYVRGLDIRSDATRLWRGVSETRYYFTPFELSPPETTSDLAARLMVTEGVIVDWWFERTPDVVLLEELHTACELMLEHLVNQRSKRLSFAELVAEADGAGLLNSPRLPARIPGTRATDAKQLLIELKDYRKDARHRGDRSFEPWLKENWEGIVLLIERLASRLPDG